MRFLQPCFVVRKKFIKNNILRERFFSLPVIIAAQVVVVVGCVPRAQPLGEGLELPFLLASPAPWWGQKTPHWSKPLWGKQLAGAITHVSLVAGGKRLWVISQFDPEISFLQPTIAQPGGGGGVGFFLLQGFDEEGHVFLQKKLAGPTREFVADERGELLVWESYANEIIAFNQKGEQLWQQAGTCRLQILQPQRQILCYHDDEVVPQAGYEVFDFQGRRVAQWPVAGRDLLYLALAPDNQHLAFVQAAAGLRPRQSLARQGVPQPLTPGRRLPQSEQGGGGEAASFNPGRLSPASQVSPSADDPLPELLTGQDELSLVAQDLKTMLWKRGLPGEVIDLALSQGARFKVAVLLQSLGSPARLPSPFPAASASSAPTGRGEAAARILIFNAQGGVEGDFLPHFRPQQVVISFSGQTVFYAGHSSQGQFLASAQAPLWQENWRIEGLPVDFALALPQGATSESGGESVEWGVEEVRAGSRRSVLLRIDASGRELQFLAQIPHEESAAPSQSVRLGQTRVVVCDDGTLSWFRLPSS